MFLQAINQALREELRRDEKVVLIGEDVHTGTFGETKGIFEEFGPERVVSTPISESGFTGAAVGAAIGGLRPVVEFMTSDFMFVAMDQLVNQAAKTRYMTGGQATIPVTFMALNMGGGAAGQHSDNTAAYFVHTPGFKVVMPSTPYDAKGLLKAAIRDDNPVIYFMEFKLFMNRQEVPDEDYTVPIGQGIVRREGKDVTIVGAGYSNYLALQVAEKLANEGISVEVVDPRTLSPLDEDVILKSVAKTGRLVVCDDDWRQCSFASEVSAIVAEKGFDYLKAPIVRVTRAQVPVPHSPMLEREMLPSEEKLMNAVRAVLK
jgi:pyruvate dehydrogenase E1 component beta subunit